MNLKIRETYMSIEKVFLFALFATCVYLLVKNLLPNLTFGFAADLKNKGVL
jgi:hypothetical protein